MRSQVLAAVLVGGYLVVSSNVSTGLPSEESPSIEGLEKQLEKRRAESAKRSPQKKQLPNGAATSGDKGYGNSAAQVRADVLQTEITDAVAAGQSAQALNGIEKLRALESEGIKVPPSLLLTEGQLSGSKGDYPRALRAFTVFLAQTPREDPKYVEALRLYAKYDDAKNEADEPPADVKSGGSSIDKSLDGAEFADVSTGDGVWIRSVVTDSAAAHAGLRTNDIVIALGRTSITNVKKFAAPVKSANILILRVRRGESTLLIPIR